MFSPYLVAATGKAVWFRFLIYVTVFFLIATDVIAEPLPADWLNRTPEALVKRAETVTLSLPYLSGQKDHQVGDIETGFEYFQRLTPGNFFETKLVTTHLGTTQSISYNLSDGKYFLSAKGLLFKMNFEEDYEIEDRLAGSFDIPYSYELLEPKTVGTNECLVVRRKMTGQFLEVFSKELYKNETEQKRLQLTPRVARAIKDFYIRKSDAVIIGYLKRNISGEAVLQDRLPDTLSVGVPISPDEFSVPNKNTAIAVTSFKGMMDLFVKHVSGTQGNGGNAQTKHKRIIVIGSLGLLALIPVVVFLARKWRGREMSS
ncbi:MAG TPA: hypothetical protein VH255_10570 [Verrucomicrobiae bacterium]|nr:hypothetical protein [Verrucomicrobiae bacterium]